MGSGTPFRSALTAASYIVAHLIVAIVLIAAVETISLILTWLGDPKLFDRVPIRYMFHTMDVAILTIFIIFAVRDTIDVFKGH